MSSRTRMSSTAAALLGLVALVATPASAAEVVLRFGSINTENTAPYDQVLLPFAKAVEEESGGRIEVALKPFSRNSLAALAMITSFRVPFLFLLILAI